MVVATLCNTKRERNTIVFATVHNHRWEYYTDPHQLFESAKTSELCRIDTRVNSNIYIYPSVRCERKGEKVFSSSGFARMCQLCYARTRLSSAKRRSSELIATSCLYIRPSSSSPSRCWLIDIYLRKDDYSTNVDLLARDFSSSTPSAVVDVRTEKLLPQWEDGRGQPPQQQHHQSSSDMSDQFRHQATLRDLLHGQRVRA